MKKRSRPSASASSAPGARSLFDLLPTDVAVYALSFLSLRERFLLTSLSKSLRRLLTARPDPVANRLLFPHTQHVPLAENLAAVSRCVVGAEKTKLSWTASKATFRCVAWGDGLGFVGEKTSKGGVVRCLSIGEEGKKLAWVHERMYQVAEGVKTSVNSLNCSNSRLFVGVSKPTCAVHCFDVASGAKLCQYASHKDSVFAIAVNKTLCFSGGGQNDNMLFASDLETQKVLWKVEHGGSVRGLDVAAENVVLSGSLCGRARVIDVRTGTSGNSVHMGGETVHGVAFLVENPLQFLVSTGRPSCCVRRWDMRAAASSDVAEHSGGVSSIVANAYAVASADYDGNVGLTSLSLAGRKKTVFSHSKTADGKNCDIHSLAACAPNVFLHCQGPDVVVHAFK